MLQKWNWKVQCLQKTVECFYFLGASKWPLSIGTNMNPPRDAVGIAGNNMPLGQHKITWFIVEMQINYPTRRHFPGKSCFKSQFNTQ